MTIDFTNREFRVNVFGILFALFVVIILVSMPGCSSGYEQKTNDNQISFSGDKSFSFKDIVNLYKPCDSPPQSIVK